MNLKIKITYGLGLLFKFNYKLNCFLTKKNIFIIYK